MISHAKILIAALPRRLRHDFKRVHAIREVGVSVQDATHVPICDEAGKMALKSPLYFIPAFAELRLYERQPERLVDRFFGDSGDDLAPTTQSIRTQRKTLAFRQRAQAVDMRRRAGCEKQRDPVALLVGEVDRQVTPRCERFRTPF